MFLKPLTNVTERVVNDPLAIRQYGAVLWSSAVGIWVLEFNVVEDIHVQLTTNNLKHYSEKNLTR